MMSARRPRRSSGPAPKSASARRRAARADVPGPMDGHACGRAERLVPVHPLGVVGREDVDVEAELREVARELERPVDARAPGGREVHGDDRGSSRLHRFSCRRVPLVPVLDPLAQSRLVDPAEGVPGVEAHAAREGRVAKRPAGDQRARRVLEPRGARGDPRARRASGACAQ